MASICAFSLYELHSWLTVKCFIKLALYTQQQQGLHRLSYVKSSTLGTVQATEFQVRYTGNFAFHSSQPSSINIILISGKENATYFSRRRLTLCLRVELARRSMASGRLLAALLPISLPLFLHSHMEMPLRRSHSLSASTEQL